MRRNRSRDGVLAGFRKFSTRAPEHPALLIGGRRFSFAELYQASDRLASALREDGLVSGERVAILLENSSAFVLGYLAVLKAGGIAVPLHPGAPARVVLASLRDCGASVVLSGARHRALLSDLPIRLADLDRSLARQVSSAEFELPEEDRLAAILYTSGTSGNPKGVMLSHGNLAAVALAGQSLVDLGPEDRVAVVTPLFHLYGLREIDAALRVGATVVVPENPRFPAQALEEIHRGVATTVSLVPSQLALWVERYGSQLQACREQLRALTLGTAPVSGKLLAETRSLLPSTRIIVTYGLTEASRVCFKDVTRPGDGTLVGAVGQPYEGVRLRIVDAGDRGTGRVAVRSAMVMQGYWRQPEATAEVLSESGELLTPDCGRIERDGSLQLLGRIDDVINCGGEKVSPEEVEEVLGRHAGVDCAAVFASADPAGILGQIVSAVVVRRPGALVTAQALAEFAATSLEPHKVPRSIEFVESLPRSVLGKPRRALLRGEEK